jgi:hypothetical protein
MADARAVVAVATEVADLDIMAAETVVVADTVAVAVEMDAEVAKAVETDLATRTLSLRQPSIYSIHVNEP